MWKYEILFSDSPFFGVARNWLCEMERTPVILISFISCSLFRVLCLISFIGWSILNILKSYSKEPALSHSNDFHRSIWNGIAWFHVNIKNTTRVIAFDCGFLRFVVCLWCCNLRFYTRLPRKKYYVNWCVHIYWIGCVFFLFSFCGIDI